MWAASVCFPCSSMANPFPILGSGNSLAKSNPTTTTTTTTTTAGFKSLSLTLKASSSFFDYPLASRVIVRNLPYSASERSLLESFSHFGQIAEVKIVKDNVTRRSKGFAFIQFTSQDEAMLAIETMDNQKLDGRAICVEVAKPGKDAFRGHPRTSGPPKDPPRLPEQEDEADCWY